ncbi:DUF4234 domain-containing protein [Candidatus Frankia nodulisporulans]|uniref:DUF4234 domain-containing protein n=1 Tax=Candidatus Frankia nodulisporulans TaxID=2060052 RepID=UPI001CDB8B09|nr:DUF4234 domain-containing protein [Candidatus Frankia nodulisporulans]
MPEAGNYPIDNEYPAVSRADMQPAPVSYGALAPNPQLPAQPGWAGAPVRPPVGAAAPVPHKQGAWGLWWLCVLTFSIYYLVWYDRINGELATVLGQPRQANSRWWNQLIPFWALVGLGATAKRLNAAHALVGSPTRVGVFTTWFWAPAWFGSHVRYLQRRVNILHDVLTSRATHPGY